MIPLHLVRCYPASSRRLFFAFTAREVCLAQPSAAKNQISGTWRYQDAEQISTYVFRPGGTFNAELRQGEKVRKFEGQWVVKERIITYTYKNDSYERANGVVEAPPLQQLIPRAAELDQSDPLVRQVSGARKRKSRVTFFALH